jgi:hypothetical protein
VVVSARCGDVNDDTVVNIGDALAVAQFDVRLRHCGEAPFRRPEVCDINPQLPIGRPDGSCNIGDALKMAQCDVGLVSCDFHQCPPFSCPGGRPALRENGRGATEAAEPATVRLAGPAKAPSAGTT